MHYASSPFSIAWIIYYTTLSSGELTKPIKNSPRHIRGLTPNRRLAKGWIFPRSSFKTTFRSVIQRRLEQLFWPSRKVIVINNHSLKEIELNEKLKALCYSRISTNRHLSTTATFLADKPYIDSCLNLLTTVTSLQRPLSSDLRWPLFRGSTVIP